MSHSTDILQSDASPHVGLTKIEKYNKHISVYYQNTRGLITKSAEIFNNTASCNFDIIALSETWLNDSVFNSEIIFNDYNIYRADRNLGATGAIRGGGVLLAVHQRNRSSIININRGTLLPQIDILAIKATFNYFTMLFLVIYVPPPVNADILENIFDFIVSLECLYGKNVCILGDFNIPTYSEFLDTGTENQCVRLLNNFLHCMYLSQSNFVRNGNNRILDLILHNNKHSVVERALDVLVHEDKHHPAISISFQFPHCIGRKHDFPVNLENNFNFRKANFPLMYDIFLNLDWSFLSQELEIETACTLFYDKLYNIINTCVPRYKKSTNKKYPPWFDSSIIYNIKRKAKCHEKYKKTGSQLQLQHFKSLRTKIKTDIKNSYNNYILKIETDIKNDPRKFWLFIKNKRESVGIPNYMNFNGDEFHNPQDILNSFAKFFKQSFSDDTINNDSANRCPYDNNYICINNFSDDDVERALKKIKPKFTTGPDLIPAFLIHDCRFVLVRPLSILFNLCLKNQAIPSLWKTSKVVPVYKKDDRAEITNYRPVSLICNFSKVLEFLLYDKIFPAVKDQIVSQQHGFFKGRSTVTNLLEVSQYIAESIDESSQVDVIYLDFSKAFDRLDHNILIHKLHACGFSDSLVRLFGSYLSNRFQYVSLYGCTSDKYSVTSGVPQGSILGPLLFNIFINDIGRDLDVSFLLYADDIKIFKKIHCLDDCLILQRSLERINDWCLNNNLQLNMGKCNVLSFTTKTSVIKYNYVLTGKYVLRSDAFCDLGVTFDAKFSFVPHINKVLSDASKSYGFIVRCTRDFNNIEVIKILYNSYVRSKLEYASVIWSPGYGVHISNLEKIQRRFLKHAWYKSEGTYPPQGFSHTDLLNKFGYVSLNDRHDYHYLITLFKILNNQLDCSDLLNRLCFYVPRINSRHSITFYLPIPKKNILKFSPIFAMCSKYNALPNLDFFSQSIFTVKKLLPH